MMRSALTLAFIALLLAGARRDHVGGPAQLYNQHRWFDLRTTNLNQRDIAPLYQGAVDAAFDNRTEAEAAFGEVFRQQPHSQAAYEAHEWLTYLYLRHGLYQEAVAETRTKWQDAPNHAPTPEERKIVDMLRGVDDQSTLTRGSTSVKLEDNGNLPILINGHTADFLIDTDSNLSFISESAAKEFGISIRPVGTEAFGAAGKAEPVRTAVADLTIGAFRLRNVFFLVFSDAMGAFEGASVREQGGLGVPVLVALQRLQITSAGICTVGIPGTADQEPEPNLAFDGEDPIVEVTVEGRKVPMIFDSGSSRTELFPPFASTFPSLTYRATKTAPKRERGFGGERAVKQVEIKKLQIQFGGFTGTLHPAHLLLQPTVGASHWADGRIGGDVLQQTHQITINYKNMTITAD